MRSPEVVLSVIEVQLGFIKAQRRSIFNDIDVMEGNVETLEELLAELRAALKPCAGRFSYERGKFDCGPAATGDDGLCDAHRPRTTGVLKFSECYCVALVINAGCGRLATGEDLLCDQHRGLPI